MSEIQQDTESYFFCSFNLRTGACDPKSHERSRAYEIMQTTKSQNLRNECGRLYIEMGGTNAFR